MIRRLLGDRRGNVAIIVALLALPMLGLVGLAIDFGQATLARARLDLAADSAALLATTAASNAYLAGAADPIATAQDAAQARFTAQAASQDGVTITTTAVAVHQSGPIFTATVTYTGAIATTLGRLFGVDTINLQGQSVASLAIAPYTDINVLMDVSSSMAIAATAAAIARMQSLTASYKPSGSAPGSATTGADGCAFACHWGTNGNDFYQLAQQNNVELRLDVLRKAVGNLVNSLTTINTEDRIRLGLYTFAQSFSQIFPLSDQTSAASGSLAQIAPDINDCSSNCPDTYFDNAMTSLASVTGTSGDGTSASAPEKFVFVVTDGLVDQYTGGNRVISPVGLAGCNALKTQGVTILVLYTPYLPLPTNAFYNDHVAPVQSQIGPGLRACATSPDLFFQADNAADINAALQEMLAKVLQTSGHLTQ